MVRSLLSSGRRGSAGEGKAMFVCVICRFGVELDDAVTPTRSGGCVCIRCYSRETGTARPMTKDLRRDISTALIPRASVWGL